MRLLTRPLDGPRDRLPVGSAAVRGLAGQPVLGAIASLGCLTLSATRRDRRPRPPVRPRQDLPRSQSTTQLLDFAKLMETFEQHHVAFARRPPCIP